MRQIVELIQIDPETGDQIQAGTGMKRYKAVSEGTVEEMYEQYAGQDIPLTAASKGVR